MNDRATWAQVLKDAGCKSEQEEVSDAKIVTYTFADEDPTNPFTKLAYFDHDSYLVFASDPDVGNATYTSAFYVAPWGDDGFDGSQDRPWKTPQPVRALCVLPSKDTCTFAAVASTGLSRFEDIAAKKYPLKLAVRDLVTSAFGHAGQKCSAASRIYVPKSLWKEVRERIVAMVAEIRMGDTNDFRNFMGAVIDQKAFDRISGYLADAKKRASIVCGGGAKGDTGWVIDDFAAQYQITTAGDLQVSDRPSSLRRHHTDVHLRPG